MKTKIKKLFPFKRNLADSFFEPLFFSLILIGFIPFILMSINITSNFNFFENYGDKMFEDWAKAIYDGVNLNGYTVIGVLLLYLITLLITTVWCFKKGISKKALYLLPGYFLVAIFLLFDKTATSTKVVMLVFSLMYLISFPFSLFHFIRRSHVRSFVFFLAFLVYNIIFGLFTALFFAGFTVSTRFIFLVFKQNIETIRFLTFKRFIIVFLKSLIFWLPLLLFVIPGNKMSKTIYESSINGIYTYVFDIEKEEGSTRGFRKVEFKRDLDDYLDKRFFHLEDSTELNNKFGRIRTAVIAGNNSISDEAGDKSKTIPKMVAKVYYEETNREVQKMNPYFQKEDCGFHIIFPTSCCIMNGMKSWMKSTILRFQKEIGAAIEKNVSHAMRKSAKELQSGATSSEAVILATLDKNEEIFRKKVTALRKAIYNSIMGFYNGVLIINLVMDVFLFLLVIKSFLVVFSRVAFSGQEEIFVSLLDPDVKMKKGEIKKCGNQYTILSSNKRNFYTSRSYEPSGRPPKFAIPQMTSAALGRIFSGTYALNHVVMKGRKGSVYYNALGGTEFVEWTLKPGEEVIFSLKNFVAMSEDVKLSTIYSFRLTSILLGRLRFTMAKGPGKLVLITKGKPITSQERKGNASVPVSRIIAFQKNTRFHVHSELNLVDVFLSGIYLEKKPSDLIIIDADEKGSAKSGISKFIKGFLIPI